MRIEIASDRGRAGFRAYCDDKRCPHTVFDTSKGKAKRAMERHEDEHKRARRAAEEQAKATRAQQDAQKRAAREQARAIQNAKKQEREQRRAEKDAATKARKSGGIAKKNRNGGWDIITDPTDSRLSWSERRKLKDHLRKERYNELKDRVGTHNAKILSELDETPASKIPQIKGLRTYGLEKYGIPDGQNVNGIVYDKDGNRITHDTLKRFVQGWGD